MTTEDQIVAQMSRVENPPESVVRGVLIETALADQYMPIDGPIGPVFIGFTPIGVSSIVPTGNEEEFLTAHAARVGRPAFPGDLPSRLADRIVRVFETGRLGKLPLDLRQLTAFQQHVLDVTATIPPGEVRPYGWVAREMGQNGAVRAVGSALGRNPVPVAVPCHRVVRSDGAIGNYAFGAEMKRSLLEHEGMTEFDIPPYLGSATTGIYCFPTCRNARRIAAGNRVEFRSVAIAAAAGFRACKVCRPV